MENFDASNDEAVFKGYDFTRKTIFNKKTLAVDITFDDFDRIDPSREVEEENIDRIENVGLEDRVKNQKSLPKDWKYASSHPRDSIIGDSFSRDSIRKEISYTTFI